MSIISNVQTDARKIAADVAGVGGAVSAILAIIVNAAPSVHIPATSTALIVSVSTVVATVIAEARRIAGSKVAPVPTPEPAPAPTPAPAKAAAKKTPAKKVAAKKSS
jgi:hypothetical protein